MSIARHHNEWLSLIEVSGPFLSMPVLMRVFPQGLDALDRAGLSELRLAYDEWLDNQNSLRPSPAIHSVWVRYILEHVLGFEKPNLLEGPVIPTDLKTFIAEQGETLRPDLVIASSDSSSPKPRLLVQIYPVQQGLEKTMHDRRWKASPAMRMMELLRATDVPLGLVTNGEQWMLVNAPRGQTSAFISWYAALWLEEQLTLRAFSSLLGVARFFSVSDEDTLEGMLKASVNEQQDVTDQLGYQVRRAVEVLIRAIDKADQDRGRALLQNIQESDLYEAALTVMMRLVFLFSAEERDLLLLGDPLYDQNYAISTLRAQLRETADLHTEDVLERRFDAWGRLLATFRAVYGGIHHDRLNLPAYGGSLFDPHRFPFLEGRTADQSSSLLSDPLPISNRTVLHLLEALQILRVKVPGGGPAEARRLSFRALDVKQIGDVYEGLLDHIAVRANELVLGLVGTHDKEPEIALSTLIAEEAKGEKNLLVFLNEQTGRSESALLKTLQGKADVFASQHLQIACNNDLKIFNGVEKYANLIRDDDFGYPAVFLAGSVYITAGATRRATGTHYTPTSLTEPVVQNTLEPLVYTGPAEGWPKEQWKLKSPAELLALKICDMAMGCGGFLVQVIHYMAARLVESWDFIAPTSIIIVGDKRLQITPEGQSATGKPGEHIIPQDDEERLILARRLVADRCIYGVDKNPLAVAIAKLSIWLTTMDKGRPFTFLDHALKCGDSLVGCSEDDFLRWARGFKDSARTLFDEELQKQLEFARQKRLELEAFEVREIRDAEYKAQLLKEADAALKHIKRGCDLLTGARLMGLKPKEAENLQLRMLFPYMTGELDNDIAPQKYIEPYRALHLVNKERALHWEFEFPEVFERGGFSAFVGNPPFIGGKKISGVISVSYLKYLKGAHNSTGATTDLCAFFFRRAELLLSTYGTLGLVATNTISQGDTKSEGLDVILNNGSEIYFAIKSQPWPGTASLEVSIINIIKGHWRGQRFLDDKLVVSKINSMLETSELENFKPNKLDANNNKAFMGTIILGEGFIITSEECKKLLEINPSYSEIIVLYMNGDDLASRPDTSPSRLVINFGDRSLDDSHKYPHLLEIVRNRVKPQREKVKRDAYRERWWQFAEKCTNLYKTVAGYETVLICGNVTKYLNFVFVPNNSIFTANLFVFDIHTWGEFVILQSTIHEIFARKFSSTLETRLSYSPRDAFAPFPFPTYLLGLEKIGETYHDARRTTMETRQEGLTLIYNRFHNTKEKSSDIVHLRVLHTEMDNAAAAAYGWIDLDLGHGFHETDQGIRFTISQEARCEVLARLLRLNHERYEEEVMQGLHEKKKEKPDKEKKGKSVRKEPGQYGLF